MKRKAKKMIENIHHRDSEPAKVVTAKYHFHLNDQEIFHSLVENGSDLFGIIDINGIYLYVADTSKALLDYEPSYFLGKSAFSFIHSLDAPPIRARLARIEAEKLITLEPFRFRSANGEWRWIESKLTNMLDNDMVRGIVVSSRDITQEVHLRQQLSIEVANRERQITRAVLQAQEKERRVIGEELHDNVNQLLSSVKLYLSVIKPENEEGQKFISKSIKTTQLAIDEIRMLSSRLVGPRHNDLGLEEAINELILTFGIDPKVRYNYQVKHKHPCKIPEETELIVYRIVQEQLTNISKHARASKVDIRLERAEKQLRLTITDNGIGFDVHGKKAGIGILNMQNRAAVANGTLHLDAAPGQGCKLQGVFPCDEKEEG